MVPLPALYTKHLEAFTHTFLAACRSLAGYDVVHFHALGPSLFAFLPRWAGRKVVVTVHGLDWKRAKWGRLGRTVLKAGAWTAVHFPHRTIVVSRWLRRHFEKDYGRGTEYIPNGVTPEPPNPIDKLRRFGLQGNDYLLFLGRLVPEKGCHLLLEAYRKTDLPQKVLIVGETSHTDNYVRHLRTLAGDDPRVVFAGALYGDDKREAYSNAACLVFPSSLEGMPIVMLEAMSYGCPVLCSDIPETLEVVEGEASPYATIFRAGSEEDLAVRLRELLQDSKGMAEKAARAREHVVETYSWDVITGQTEALYASLVGN
jgi:glycosyltransferase involved in cell wall biosynthesis